MPTDRPVYDRSDTLLGVCEAIGQDFGFNPLGLRIVIAVSLLWHPLISLSIYAGLAVAVLTSRLLFPSRAADPTAAGTMPVGDNDDHAPPVALAA